MVAWLCVALATVGGAAASLYLRWQWQREKDQADLWRTQAKRSAGELADLVKLGRDERVRLEEVIRGLRGENEAARRRIADLVRGNPELAREFLVGVLKDAAAPAADPGVHAPLPGGPAPAAGPARGGRGGGH